jgi:hypothetical protein
VIDGDTLRLVRGEELVQGWRHPDDGIDRFAQARPRLSAIGHRSRRFTAVKEPVARRTAAYV